MVNEYTDQDAIQEMEKFFEEVNAFARMFASQNSPWNLGDFKKEVATVWFPEFKKAFKEGRVDPSWGNNPNHAFVKWCWHNLVKFKEGIINSSNPVES